MRDDQARAGDGMTQSNTPEPELGFGGDDSKFQQRAGLVGPAGDRSECGICRRPLPLARMFDSTVRLCWPCHLKQFKGAKR